MSTALAYSIEDAAPAASEVSSTLSVSAQVAYEVFADAVETPRWLPVVRTAKVLARHADGRPARVHFQANLERGSLAYSLDYTYDLANMIVAWSTPATSNIVVSGEARFIPLSSRASLLVYRLVLDLPIMSAWADPSYDGHPASSVVAEFREHLRRLC